MIKNFLITVDVEDWFHVENLKPWIPFEIWNHQELRVERNVHQLLNLFDSFEIPSKPEPNAIPKKKVHATFFMLGWIAQRLPGLVTEIHNRGHEVASHGINHKLSYTLNDSLLVNELTDSKKLLEDITGSPVHGFRAPNFAINQKVINAIKMAGYSYDSSFNSFSLHGRYGKINVSDCETVDVAYKLYENFYELPISNLPIFGKPVPWGGGAYFRFIPSIIFRQGVRWILKKNDTYLFYIHPWEIDPEQPRIGKPFAKNRIKHYYNQKRTLKNLQQLISSFLKCRFTTCRDYISGLA